MHALPLQGPLDGDEDGLLAEGRGDKIVGAFLDGLFGGLNGAVGGNDNNGHGGVDILDDADEVDAIHQGHFEVGDHQVVMTFLEQFAYFQGIIGRGDLVAGLIHEDGGLTPKKVGEWLDFSMLSDVIGKFTEAFEASFPDDSYTKNGESPKVKTEKKN